MMAYTVLVIMKPLSDFYHLIYKNVTQHVLGYLGITAAVKQSELKETFHGR